MQQTNNMTKWSRKSKMLIALSIHQFREPNENIDNEPAIACEPRTSARFVSVRQLQAISHVILTSALPRTLGEMIDWLTE